MEALQRSLSSSAGTVPPEFVESNGKTTLLTLLVREVVPELYRLRDGVTDDQARAFLADTRNVFAAMRDVLPDNPFVCLLNAVSAVQTEKSAAYRVAVVASIMRPHEPALRRRDERVLLGTDVGLMHYFSRPVATILRDIWGELDDDNRDVLWLWILRILDNVCRITVPV